MSHLSHAVFEERMRLVDEALVQALLCHLDDGSTLKRCVILWKCVRNERSSASLDELVGLLDQLITQK